MWTRTFRRIILPLVLSVALAGCSFLPKEEPMLAPPLVEPVQLDYATATAMKGELVKRVKGSGAFVSDSQHDLYYSKDGGRLKESYVAVGDVVEKGQLLAEIETGYLAFDLKQTQLELEKAELRVEQLQEQSADRYMLQMAKLDLQSIKNRIELMNTQLEEARIIAPIDGSITFVSGIRQGQFIPAYETIVQVADASRMRLEFTAISSADIVDVKQGMEAIAVILKENVWGKVVQTPMDIPAELFQTNPDHYGRTLIIGFDELPDDLTIGTIVNFEIITARQENALIIPRRGLRTTSGRNYVQLLADNTKREIDIETGMVSATEVEVLNGLNEGDEIILK